MQLRSRNKTGGGPAKKKSSVPKSKAECKNTKAESCKDSDHCSWVPEHKRKGKVVAGSCRKKGKRSKSGFSCSGRKKGVCTPSQTRGMCKWKAFKIKTGDNKGKSYSRCAPSRARVTGFLSELKKKAARSYKRRTACSNLKKAGCQSSKKCEYTQKTIKSNKKGNKGKKYWSCSRK